MIQDQTLMFGEATDLSGAAATEAFPNVLDFNAGNRRLGAGHRQQVAISITTAFAGAGTVVFALVSDSGETIAVDGSATIHAQSQDFAIADLPAGTKIFLDFPAGPPVSERYLGLLVTRSGTVSAGAATAGFVVDADDWAAMPDAVN